MGPIRIDRRQLIIDDPDGRPRHFCHLSSDLAARLLGAFWQAGALGARNPLTVTLADQVDVTVVAPSVVLVRDSGGEYSLSLEQPGELVAQLHLALAVHAERDSRIGQW